MIAAVAPLPDDTQDLVRALRKPRWHVVTGRTLNVIPIKEQAKAESGDSEDVKRHLAMWERFRGRIDKRPRLVEHRQHLRSMADDIRWWEASKAGIRIDEPDVRLWFWAVPAAGRVELVKIERGRRAEERRFRLALNKKRVAA